MGSKQSFLIFGNEANRNNNKESSPQRTRREPTKFAKNCNNAPRSFFGTLPGPCNGLKFCLFFEYKRFHPKRESCRKGSRCPGAFAVACRFKRIEATAVKKGGCVRT